MIKGSVQGQELIIGSSVIAADTINYLTAEFIFRTSDWDGLVKIARLSNGANSVEVQLTDDKILASDGLNLTEGSWDISLTGYKYVNGELEQRITTIRRKFTVHPSDIPDGDPLPSLPSLGEQILGKVAEIKTEVDSMTASAEMLPSGSEAFANVTTQDDIIHISFGIPKGDTGEKGDKGDKGGKGDTGATGPQGSKGDTGAVGPKGDKGDIGVTGPKGDKGDPGVIFTPSVSSSGVLSWSNNGGKENPDPVDIVTAVLGALPSAVGVSF